MSTRLSLDGLISVFVTTIVLLSLETLLSNRKASAQSLPAGFSTGKVQGGYELPVGLDFSNDKKQLFVWERRGLVWVSNWNGSTYVRQSTPVLDIREEVADWGEVGLLSLCLDPNFSSNGLVYLFYAVDRHHLLYYNTPQYNANANIYNEASIGRVTRYRVQKSNNILLTDPASRRVLLGEDKKTGIPLLKGLHLGGTILFGRDGTLLISTGDNASWAVVDAGSSSDTFYQTALSDSIMRPAENVGALRAQLLNSHCGKVLRIDAETGDGLQSNPFFDPANPRSAQSRVWALGFRNPFKMSLQPNTGSTDPRLGDPGTLLVGDVGWFSWEEINVIDRPGLNAGWPLYEGMGRTSGYYGTNVRNTDEPNQPTFESLCQPPKFAMPDSIVSKRRFAHARPAIDWQRDQLVARVPTFNGNNPSEQIIGSPGVASGKPFGGNCAIDGMYYNSDQFPAIYKNTYFFADFGQGWIKNILFDPKGNGQIREVREFAAPGSTRNIVALSTNTIDGSIYYIDGYSGEIQRIGYGGNRPPEAVLEVDTTFGSSPLNVRLKASKSKDPDGNNLYYEWNFGDGTMSTSADTSHIFISDSIKANVVTLTVYDEYGLSDTKTVTISINNLGPPTVKIANPVNGSFYSLSQVTQLTLKANAEDVRKDTSNTHYVNDYKWQVILRHNTHEHREPIISAVSPTVSIDPTGCDFGETYYYLIKCTVTDNGGLTATDSVKIYPDCQSGNISVSDVKALPDNGDVQISWKNPSILFDEVLVAVQADSGFTDNPSSINYVADANFLGNGSTIANGKVVYIGRDTTVRVTGLTASKMYFFRVYTRVGTGWNGGVEVSTCPVTENGSLMYTVKDGAWNDPLIWSCNRIPTSNDTVLLKHQIIIPDMYISKARKIMFDAGVRLKFGVQSILRLIP